MRTGRLLALLALLGFAAAAPAAATDASMALGPEGEVYRVLVGAYGSLIAGAPAAQAGNAALVLERVTPGAAPARALVPGTDDPAVEKYPSLTIDPASDSVFVVWEAQATIHSTVHLAAYSGGRWSSVFELSGDPFSAKINPRVAVTRDDYRVLDDAGNPVELTRVVLHLAWFDIGGNGERTLYAPLVIEDGVFLSDWHVFDLEAFLDEAAPSATAGTLPPTLAENAVVQASGDGTAAIIAFGSTLSGRVATLVSRPVSAGLVSWADEARHQIIDTGLTVRDRRALVDKARHQIIDTGRRILDRDAADLLAAKFLEAIATSDPNEDLEAVVDKARHQIIDTGARLDSTGTRFSGARAKSQIGLGESGDAARSGHIALLEVVASWSAPSLPNRTIRMLPSGDGGSLALAWDVDGAVRYRMSQGAGWSEVRTLTLGADLSRDRAYELIERRVARR